MRPAWHLPRSAAATGRRPGAARAALLSQRVGWRQPVPGANLFLAPTRRQFQRQPMPIRGANAHGYRSVSAREPLRVTPWGGGGFPRGSPRAGEH
eukprot:2688352-Prymnesium_polylepis.2